MTERKSFRLTQLGEDTFIEHYKYGNHCVVIFTKSPDGTREEIIREEYMNKSTAVESFNRLMKAYDGQNSLL